MKIRSLLIVAAITFGGAPLLSGCDETLEKEQSTEVKPDGTVVEKKEEVKREADGTIVKEETKKVERPTNE